MSGTASEPVEERRSWLPIGVAAAVLTLALGLIVGVRSAGDDFRCAQSASAQSPLLDNAERARTPDERLDRLAAAVNAMGEPFGEVRAGLGYDYDQFLHLYGVGDGLLSFTKNNAPFAMLDDRTLAARWALRPENKRIAWDASADRFLLLGLAAKGPIRAGLYDLGSGEQRWCVRVRGKQADGQPVATTFLPDGDVVLALPEKLDGKQGIRLGRLDAKDGLDSWSRYADDVGRADFLGPLDADRVVVGGVEEHRLAQPDPAAAAGPVVAVYDTRDRGSDPVTFSARKGESVHVAGVHDGHVLVVVASAAGSRLVSLDGDLKPTWSITPADGAVESTLRGGVLLMRTRTSLDGYDAATGRQLWHRAIPTSPTFFPYGFTLSQMPSLGDTRVLMATTTALRVLDTTTGDEKAYPLPTDGINTTYWPYQVSLSEHAIGIVTNTGSVVAVR